MSGSNALTNNTNAVSEFLATLDEQTAHDARELSKMMQRISGQQPKMWSAGTLGYDTYHYKYESGREGDCHVIGFHPRKDKITLYLMDGTEKYIEPLSKLVKHKTGKVCVYIKRLSDVDLEVLQQILQQSYAYVKSLEENMHQS